MPWAVTMHITACAGGAAIPSAFVTDGTSTYYTNSYGDFIAVVYDDTAIGWSLNVGKAGYVTRNVAIYQSQSGTTQTFCLDVAPVTPSGPTNHCFIVSATTGSPESAENMRLNMLRDRVLRTTDIGASLLDAIYADYYRFSPPIARELKDDPLLREQVLRVGVRPLLAWYGLVEALALDGDPSGIRHAAQAVLDACRGEGRMSAATVAMLFEAIRRGDPVPADADAPFPYLAARLEEAVTLPFAQWAILRPLALAWAGAAGARDVIQSAAAWLADAPLDQLPAPPAGDRLDAELAQLAHGPFASAPLREQVGARLHAMWPHLDRQLRRHGFVAGDARQPAGR